MKLQLVGALIGNVLEWYDYGIFGALTEPISECFFPDSSPGAKLLSTLAVFTSGFVARPVGGALFGWLGDRYGRKPALLLAVVLMAASTFGIGILPCYASWGIVSPLLLTVLRVCEGLSVGGELVGGILLLVESAPSHRQRGLYGSAAMATASLGIALGFLAVGALQLLFADASPHAWRTYVWRLPFLLGLVVAAFALWIRRYLHESPEFLQRLDELRDERPANPLLLAVRNYKLAMLLSFCVLVFGSFGSWVGFFLPNYVLYRVPDAVRLHQPAVVYLFMLVVPALVLYWGHLADHWGALRCMLIGAVCTALLSVAFFAMVASGSLLLSLLGIFLFSSMIAAYAGPLCVWLAESFAVEVRYSAVALAYNAAQALLGGSSQLIIGALLVTYPQHYVLYPALATSAVACISVVALVVSHKYMATVQNFADGFFNTAQKPTASRASQVERDDDDDNQQEIELDDDAVALKTAG